MSEKWFSDLVSKTDTLVLVRQNAIWKFVVSIAASHFSTIPTIAAALLRLEAQVGWLDAKQVLVANVSAFQLSILSASPFGGVS